MSTQGDEATRSPLAAPDGIGIALATDAASPPYGRSSPGWSSPSRISARRTSDSWSPGRAARSLSQRGAVRLGSAAAVEAAASALPGRYPESSASARPMAKSVLRRTTIRRASSLNQT